jgi:hypothetical protein
MARPARTDLSSSHSDSEFNVLQELLPCHIAIKDPVSADPVAFEPSDGLDIPSATRDSCISEVEIRVP